MAKSEYLGVTNEEKTFWQRGFLQTELELLQIAKNLEILRQLRKEEFLLRIGVKNKVEEAHSMLMELERKLPKAEFRIKSHEERKKEREINEDLTLQGEIEAIRKKIEELQQGF